MSTHSAGSAVGPHPGMPIPMPPTPQPKVLVVHVNFGAAGAIAYRLMETSVVSLASVPAALGGVLRHGGHDVVVMGPYLRPDERRALLAQAVGLDRPVSVVELSHAAGGVHAEVVAQDDAQRAAARMVLAALDLLAP